MRRTPTSLRRLAPCTTESLERRVLFAAGDLETTFGAGGYATADFGDGRVDVDDVATNAQRLVAVGRLFDGNQRPGMVIAAWRHDGTLDPTFSGDGKLMIANADPLRMAIQPDGKILVVAAMYKPDGTFDETSLLRFNSNGTPDTTFGGGDGRASGLAATGLSLAPGGKIVLGGTDFTPPRSFVVQRLNPDGSPDTSFGGDGVVTGNFNTGGEDNASWEGGGNTAVQPDGKIVLTGTVYGASEDGFWDGAVVRLNPDGSFDNTFSNNGRMVLDFGSVDDFADDVTIDRDGSILVAAIAGEATAMPVRITPNGGSFQRFSPGFVYESPTIYDLWVDSVGRVVVSGTDDDPFLGRYLANGTFEPGFGGSASGMFVQPLGYQSALAPDDGIYIGVNEFVANDGVLRVAKHRNSGGEDAAGTVTLSGGTLTVTGTTRNDQIRVDPGGAAGRVTASVNGYARTFDGVSRVSVSGGTGDDDIRLAEAFNLPTTLNGGTGDDTIWGGAGNDTINGGDGTDYLLSRAGDDVLDGGAGHDSLFGFEGNDRLLGGEDLDSLDGGEGADFISGGTGADSLNYRTRTRALRITLDDDIANDGEAGENDNVQGDVETIEGGQGDDYIEGNAGPNVLWGGTAGNDTLRGMGGNDDLYTYGTFGTTQYGNDRLEGGDGEDVLRSGGSGGVDAYVSTLLGGNGNDQLWVRPGDIYDGGPGLDSVNGVREDGIPTNQYPNRIWLDEQADTLHVEGLDSNDVIRVTLDNSTNPATIRAEYRGVGNVAYNVPLADVARVQVSSSGGNDVIDLSGLTVPAFVHAGSENDSVIGGERNDQIEGSTGHDTLRGGAGDDALIDTEGDNVFDGGPGADTVNGTPETPTGETRYEAESATVSGARVRMANPGYTGGGYADYINSGGDYVDWTVTAGAAGNHTLAFRYASSGSDRPLELRVNGAVVRSRLSFPSTGSFSTWREVTVDVPLRAGTNNIRLTAVGQSGPNVDALTVRPVDQPPPGGEVVVQAEQTNGVRQGATIGRSQAGYTGTGYIDFAADSGANVSWNVNGLAGPGEYVIDFRYANGSASPRTLSIEASPGTPAKNVTFAPTGSWSTWRTVSVPVTLTGGGNALSVTARTIGSNGPNIDSLTTRRVTSTDLELQAEEASLVGARIKSEQPGFQGTGYADYANASGDSAEWTFDHAGGSRTLTFRYANGAASDRPLELRVNGAVVNPRLSFAPTVSWSTWREVSVTVQLASGQNRVRLTSIGNNGPNVDVLRVS